MCWYLQSTKRKKLEVEGWGGVGGGEAEKSSKVNRCIEKELKEGEVSND